MRIYRPVKTNLISQGFGPSKTNKTMLPFYQSLGLKAHNGIDFVAPRGEPVLWPGYDVEGTVIKLSTEVNQGLGVVIITEDKDGIFQHRFWHLLEIKCKVGQKLSAGDLIGLVDSTGYSTGDHLHYDLKPMKKDEFGRLVAKEPDNGYFGAIDPWPFFVNVYIGDLLDNLSKMILSIQKSLSLLSEGIKQLLKGRKIQNNSK